jgi:hypothetical protein
LSKAKSDYEKLENQILLLMLSCFGAGFAMAIILNWFKNSKESEKELDSATEV